MLPKNRKCKTKYFVKNLLLFVISIFFSLILLEIIISIFYPQELVPNFIESHPTLKYFHKKNFEGIQTSSEFKIHIKINSKGLRDNEYDYKKDENLFRILILGDSYTFGDGVELNETYLKKLERLLNEKNNSTYKKFEVINAGVNGWGTDQELIYLKEEGLKYKPDLVLIGFTINDFEDNIINKLFILQNGTLIQQKAKSNLMFFRDIVKYIPFYDFLSQRSHLLTFIRKRITSLATSLEREDINWLIIFNKTVNYESLERWNLTISLIKEISNITYDNNISLAIIMIPLPIEVKQDFLTSIDINNNDFDTSLPNKALNEFCEKNDIFVINLLPKIKEYTTKGYSLYYEKDLHWNSMGHELSAEIIYKKLKNSGLIN